MTDSDRSTGLGLVGYHSFATHRCGFPGIQTTTNIQEGKRDVALKGCPAARSQPSDSSNGQHSEECVPSCVRVFPVSSSRHSGQTGDDRVVRSCLASPLPRLAEVKSRDERFVRDSSDRYVNVMSCVKAGGFGSNKRQDGSRDALGELKNHRNGKWHRACTKAR